MLVCGKGVVRKRTKCIITYYLVFSCCCCIVFISRLAISQHKHLPLNRREYTKISKLHNRFAVRQDRDIMREVVVVVGEKVEMMITL